ncbi:D-proline reductase (dithiol) [Natranaerobius thermophilus JW/NM-WN-LF]|uniref:D-proline reductase (Dithiol) n=1 Tax=Natranaerobius thermophilus (strain ATCC BAA-1301 / DSM 18059 / JW/NM-WN-LF) TaxID=457570 RepID=B2A2P9_NATTJ|nr:proline reductase [Natranaerobius thermophilus]ACB86267.1 D-proline reductase (dithiol) [Natranaerobius thermophilus JW/NM-WN-LF]
MIVQRRVEEAGIPTIMIAALHPVAKQQGSPRAVHALVPMGANVGPPNDVKVQKNIIREALQNLIEIDEPGKFISIPYEYQAKI